MLDHIFSDAIGALREALDSAHLEHQALEERFHSDMMLGNITWETSYVLPGEDNPPRICCDLTLEWSSWSQTAYRHWFLQGELTDLPEIAIAVVIRIQNLTNSPQLDDIVTVLPKNPPPLGNKEMNRSGATIESNYGTKSENTLQIPEWAIEVTYEGNYELEEVTLENGTEIDEHFSQLGGWISSALVRVDDLKLEYRSTNTTEN